MMQHCIGTTVYNRLVKIFYVKKKFGLPHLCFFLKTEKKDEMRSTAFPLAFRQSPFGSEFCNLV